MVARSWPILRVLPGFPSISSQRCELPSVPPIATWPPSRRRSTLGGRQTTASPSPWLKWPADSAARSISYANAAKSGASRRFSHVMSGADPRGSPTRSRCSTSSCARAVRYSRNDHTNDAPTEEAGSEEGRNELMVKREKLPPGLYRRRRRDGTRGETLWRWFRPRKSKQPVKMSTGTSDVEQAQRFLYAKLAEDPNEIGRASCRERV